MSIPTCIAVYFIIWWVCLFMVLPFGVRNSHEAGEAVAQGNEAGAPVSPMLVKKVVATTVLSAVVFTLVWGQVTYGWIGFEDIPFLGRIGAKG
jgi:predicted secreted protein